MNNIKDVNVKNRTCYYFDDIIKIEYFDFDNILLDDKSNENVLVNDILYKTLIGTKPLGIRFNKVDGFMRVYDEIRYLILFGEEKYDFIYKRIRCLIGVKSGITIVISICNFAKIKFVSYDSLSLEKI